MESGETRTRPPCENVDETTLGDACGALVGVTGVARQAIMCDLVSVNPGSIMGVMWMNLEAEIRPSEIVRNAKVELRVPPTSFVGS